MSELDPIAIVAPAPARRLRFANAEQALAYYSAVGVKTREDVIVLAELALAELKKVNEIWDGVIRRCEAAKAAEEAENADES